MQHGEAANDSVDRLQFVRSYVIIWITVAELIHATNAMIIQITMAILELIYATNFLISPPGREVQVH